MLVYVRNKHGDPLMPCHSAKARILLKEGKAEVVLRKPFTIQLKYGSSGYKQELTLGVDTGYEKIGVSVVSEKAEVFSAEVKLRTDISKRVTEKRMYRRGRRGRLRYRKPRFLNRKKKQVLAPSVNRKVESHISVINFVKSILPITKTIIETGSFDPHKLKNPDIKGKDYQKGEQFGYENVKAYILAREGHQCYFNKGCSKKVHVHHIVFRSDGGSDTPSNLITLCEKHHDQLHKGKIKLPAVKHKSLKSATVMNIIRSEILKRLRNAQESFGYITKAIRQELGLEKTHANDAFVIASGKNQKRAAPIRMFFKRKNNRSLQLNRKGFKPSVRRQRYSIQPHDIVRWQGKLLRAIGIQNKGAYLKMTDGMDTIVKSVKQIQVIFHQKSLIAVRRSRRALSEFESPIHPLRTREATNYPNQSGSSWRKR